VLYPSAQPRSLRSLDTPKLRFVVPVSVNVRLRMARWIFLITPPTYSLETIAHDFSALPDFSIRGPDQSTLLLHTRYEASDDSFFTSAEFDKRVQLENFTFAELLADCEEEERTSFEGITDASVFFVKWGDDNFLRKVFNVLASDPTILVDNEHGLILPIQEFLQWWKKNPTERIG
jgi:hypothetical protein